MEGREASPTAGVIDSQSMKTTEAAGPRGYDAGKKINGRKRHLLVDTMGLLIAAIVHRADIQDRDGAPLLLATMRSAFPWLHLRRCRLCRRQAPAGACQARQLDLRDRPALRYRQRLRAVTAAMGRERLYNVAWKWPCRSMFGANWTIRRGNPEDDLDASVVDLDPANDGADGLLLAGRVEAIYLRAAHQYRSQPARRHASLQAIVDGGARILRTDKHLFATRPIFHKLDETIRGHVDLPHLSGPVVKLV
jgi:hypothetical protein